MFLLRINFGLFSHVWNVFCFISDTCSSWRHDLVVKTSVLGRRTFPELCSNYGWQVTTLWVNCPLGSSN